MTNLPTEVVQANEAQITTDIVDAVIATQVRNHVPGTIATRDVHTKSSGTITGILRVLQNIPAICRLGVFGMPFTYPVVIRLSNGAPGKGPDIIPNVRGCAVKVFDIPGLKLIEGDETATCVDFLLANHPSAFHSRLEDYPGVQKFLSTGNIVGMLKAFPHEGRMLLRAVLKFVKNPLHIAYHSQTPYSLGDRAVKYALIPRASFWQRVGWLLSFPNIFDKDYLRHAVERTLAKGPVTFDLCVQFQGEGEPIEDPSVRWKGEFIPVAEVIIDAHAGELPELAGEALSFNPWRTLAAHRPLGWANRVRRAVYIADFNWRKSVNTAK